MTNSDKKLAVFLAVKQLKKPISLFNLLQILGPQYNERTVRRYLSQMVDEKMIRKIGQKKATKYEAIASRGYFCRESETIIEKARKPIYERDPVAYSFDWFDAYQPNKTFYISEEIREKLYKAGLRAVKGEPAGTYAHQIFNRLLIDLSYNSSRLEGNTYSLLETQKLLLEGTSAEGKLDEEKIMILNHKEAIRYLVDGAANLLLNKEMILTLHYLLSDSLLDPADSGKVRRHSVRIGGSTYTPLEDPKLIERQLEAILHKGVMIRDPYEQSFFLLVHISYLQAFSDVNKRSARLAANAPLIKNNLVPLSFSDIEQTDYISALISIYEFQEVGPLVDLYAFSYLRTAKIYDATIEASGFDEVRALYRSIRRKILRDIISKNLHKMALESFITALPMNEIQKEHREHFIKNIREDLEQLDASRIAGLGITKAELERYLRG
jgi:Fic family protein